MKGINIQAYIRFTYAYGNSGIGNRVRLDVSKRHELPQEQWREIKDLLPGKVGDRGRTAVYNRTFFNDVL